MIENLIKECDIKEVADNIHRLEMRLGVDAKLEFFKEKQCVMCSGYNIYCPNYTSEYYVNGRFGIA